MKTKLTILLIAIATITFASKYEETMKSNIEKVYKATSSNELSELANQFERIASAEKDKWIPAYYAAYCHTSTVHFKGMDTEEQHKQLDKAQSILNDLKKNYREESEIYCLQALVYQLRITDMSKGYKYSKLASEAISQAERLNPKNPRVYYLRGSNTFHTPKFFGGGPSKAKDDLAKASGIFESYQPENELMPMWGEEHNNRLLNRCE